jgi:hypothetical protein
VNLGPLADVAAARSPCHGRVVLIASSDETRARAAIDRLATRPGVAARPRGSGILVSGIPRLVGNYLLGRDGGRREGIAGLLGEQAFLAAARRLADEPLVALAEQTGAATIIDWSPGLERSPNDEIARALYPDARLVDDEALTALLAGSDPDAAAPAGPPAAGGDADDEVSPFDGRVVFVLGAPRSGTTWLTGLLLAHPDAVGLSEGETWIFQALRDLWTNADLAGWLEPERLARAVRRFVDEVFAGYRDATNPGASTFVEKSPTHVFRLQEMAAVYPDASYVHIVRDGRDAARSMAEMDHGQSDVATAARYWADSIRAVRRDQHLLARFREVRYEDVVADPVATVCDVMAWVGLSVNDDVRGVVADRVGIRVSRHGTTGPVGPGKWRAMPRRDLAVVEREAGPVLAELGYTAPRARFLRR